MARQRLSVLTGLIAAVIVLSAAAASAADALGNEAGVSLNYQAVPACPSRAAVVEQLELRGLRVNPAASERRLSMDLASASPQAAGFAGTLTVAAAKGRPALSQTVRGQDCHAVMLSLALVAALALGPTVDAALEPPRADERAAIVGGAGAPVADPRPTWFVGVTGHGMSALGSGAALGLGGFVERVWGRAPGAMGTLVLSAASLAPPTLVQPSGTADLRAYLARLEGCWFGGLLAGERVFLSPCVGMDGGVLRGTGNIGRPLTATRPWLAPVVSGRGAARLTRGLWLTFEASAFAPLVRDTFVFNDPRAIIHRSPALGAGLGLGLAGAF